MLQLIGDNGAVISSFFAALATLFAAIATWRGPRSAVKLAEALRIQNDRIRELRVQKMDVFTTLIQHRQIAHSEESTKALNLIDLVYIENRRVRDAWSRLFDSYDNGLPDHEQRRRYQELLSEMALDLGVSDNLHAGDFGRVYMPRSVGLKKDLELMEMERRLHELQQEIHPDGRVAAPTGVEPADLANDARAPR